MVDLTVYSEKELVSLNSIAERQSISLGYLEQVFSALKKSGIVKSTKGSQGGYTLTADAKNISVGNVLRALEGEIYLTDEADDDGDNAKIIRMIMKINVWNKINEAVSEVIDNTTLEDLAKDYRKIISSPVIMYYI